jgi:hypothetical protein
VASEVIFCSTSARSVSKIADQPGRFCCPRTTGVNARAATASATSSVRTISPPAERIHRRLSVGGDERAVPDGDRRAQSL